MAALAAALLAHSPAAAAPCVAPTAPDRDAALRKPVPPVRPTCGELCDNPQIRAFNSELKTFNTQVEKYNAALADYVTRLNAFVRDAGAFAKCEIDDVQAATPPPSR